MRRDKAIQIARKLRHIEPTVTCSQERPCPKCEKITAALQDAYRAGREEGKSLQTPNQ